MAECNHCGEDVEFETDYGGDPICPSCGWAQSSGTTRGRTQKRSPVGARAGWARFAAAILLLQGLASIASFIGIIDIWISIGLFRLKERSRETAVILGIVQLVIMGIAFVFFAAMMRSQPFLSGYLTRYIVVLPVLAPLKIISIVILTRPGVRAAFS